MLAVSSLGASPIVSTQLRDALAARVPEEMDAILDAMADLRPQQCENAKKWLEEKGRPGAKKVYAGAEESWKALCDDPDVDVVYVTAPAVLHARMELYALRAGKHVLTEVPGARTLDEAWEIVETCEKARRHCMMLENCCYGETRCPPPDRRAGKSSRRYFRYAGTSSRSFSRRAGIRLR